LLASALVILCFTTAGVAAPDVIIDAGVFSDGTFSLSGGINASGQVVGEADTQGTSRAFLWDAQGGLRTLGLLGINSSANSINARGQVVGRFESPLGERAFLWDAINGMRDLGTLPNGTSSRAYSINAGGQIVGDSDMGTGVSRAVLWTSTGSIQDLGTLLGGTSSNGYAINDRGQVVGESNTPTSAQRAFIWEAGVMLDLGTLPGGTISVASGINNQSQVVGFSDTATGAIHAFLWDAVRGMIDLGTLTPDGSTIAFGINDLGQVVGQEVLSDATSQAFVWEAGVMRALRSLPGTTFSAAYGINENRQAVGDMNSFGNPHAVVWQLNRPPTANNQTVGTTQDVALPITLTGSDADNDPLTFSIVAPPVNGSLSGTPPNVIYTSRSGYSGTDQFTFTVSDGSTTSVPATVSITVTPTPPPPPPEPNPDPELRGRIYGHGHLKSGGKHHHVEFAVRNKTSGEPRGWLHYHVNQHGADHAHSRGRFVSTAITQAVFSDDPASKPGHKPNPVIDTVVFSGTGRWNKKAGYTFEATATDAGEPGPGRDSFTLTIRSPEGEVVVQISGKLLGGNIQSLRL
jgi:probable HAF family extracellular repeat protein